MTWRLAGEALAPMTPPYLKDYCRHLDCQASQTIGRLDAMIRGWQPDLPITIWQSMGYPIIGYGRAEYQAGGGDKQWFIVGLAAHKSYFSLYVWGVWRGKYLLEAYKDHLGRVKIGKACLNFKALDDLDLGGLRALIDKAVELQTNQPASGDSL